MTDLEQFFERKDICVQDIMYMYKTPQTNITEFHLKDGRVETRYVALKNVLKELPKNFVSINKGIIINLDYVKCVNRFVYHMTDGNIFYGKLKKIKFHEAVKYRVENKEKGSS